MKNTIKTALTHTAFALWTLAATACGGAYANPDGSNGDASVDTSLEAGVVCHTADGRILSVGESYPDRCATCTCTATGTIECEGPMCPPEEDVPPVLPCNSNSDCGAGSMCIGPQGCGVPWTCQPAQGCTADVAPFCSCNGVTVYGSSSCPPEPYMHTGPCESIDGGGPSCAGASRGPNGQCLGPNDGPLPDYCCPPITDAGGPDASTGFDCAPAHASCDSLPGPCPVFSVRTVRNGCWGECVVFDQCAAIPCDPSQSNWQCPAGTMCNTDSNTCGFGAL